MLERHDETPDCAACRNTGCAECDPAIRLLQANEPGLRVLTDRVACVLRGTHGLAALIVPKGHSREVTVAALRGSQRLAPGMPHEAVAALFVLPELQRWLLRAGLLTVAEDLGDLPRGPGILAAVVMPNEEDIALLAESATDPATGQEACGDCGEWHAEGEDDPQRSWCAARTAEEDDVGCGECDGCLAAKAAEADKHGASARGSQAKN